MIKSLIYILNIVKLVILVSSIKDILMFKDAIVIF